jgi:hypothetical protein
MIEHREQMKIDIEVASNSDTESIQSLFKQEQDLYSTFQNLNPEPEDLGALVDPYKFDPTLDANPKNVVW